LGAEFGGSDERVELLVHAQARMFEEGVVETVRFFV